MSSLLKQFKEFAFKGNVIDMAVGVIVGGAFSTIVTSLVNDIIMPVFGYFTAGVNFDTLKVVLSPATEEKAEAAIMYGSFVQNIINFLIIAICIFAAITLVNKAMHKDKKEEPAAPPAPTEAELLAEIRDLLKEQKDA